MRTIRFKQRGYHWPVVALALLGLSIALPLQYGADLLSWAVRKLLTTFIPYTEEEDKACPKIPRS